MDVSRETDERKKNVIIFRCLLRLSPLARKLLNVLTTITDTEPCLCVASIIGGKLFLLEVSRLAAKEIATVIAKL